MIHRRSIMAGMTDYTGVPLADILSDLREWSAMTRQAITTLGGLRAQVEASPAIFRSPRAAVEYIDYFCNLFERYAGDFDRLLGEIPRGVTEAHIEILLQLYQSTRTEDYVCVRFKSDFLARDFPNDDARSILDDIYSETRSILIDYGDLSNLVPRLRTFVTTAPTGEGVLQLKPTVWGIGVDLKAFGRWLLHWWRRVRAT